MWRDESWCEVSVCVIANVLIVPILISLWTWCDLDLSGSVIKVDGSQTLAFSKSVALVSHASTSSARKRMANMETTPVQQLPKRTPVKAVLECVRNGTSLLSEGTPVQNKTDVA